MELYKVLIIEESTGEISEELGPDTERNCEKIERGVNINLNHDHYYTSIVKVED